MRSKRAALSSVTAGWITGLPFCRLVWSTLFAAVIAGKTSRTASRTLSVRPAGSAAKNTPSSSFRWTRILPGAGRRTAYGRVEVSATTISPSRGPSPRARFHSRAPPQEPGQTMTTCPGARCSRHASAKGRVL